MLVVWAIAAAAILVLAVVLATSQRAQTFVSELKGRADASALAAGFQVRRVVVQGALPQTRAAILAAARMRVGDPVTGVDLAAARGRIESLGTLSEVRVVRMLPDTVVISVRERARLALWQHDRRVSVIDTDGRVIGEAAPSAYPNLPLVVGEGAQTAAAPMLAALQAHPRIAAATAALVRVDGRRWDLRLRDGGAVLLPATDMPAALARLDELDRSTRLLELGFARIDLRNPEIIGVRPRPTASAAARAAAAAAAPTPTPAATPMPSPADAAAEER